MDEQAWVLRGRGWIGACFMSPCLYECVHVSASVYMYIGTRMCVSGSQQSILVSSSVVTYLAF